MSTPGGKAEKAANGTATRNGSGPDTVRRDDFAKDPGRFVAAARTKGSVTITDASGKPRMMIVVPKAIVGYDE